MVRASTEAILAGFSEGVFTVAVHRGALDGVASFDFLVGSSARVNELLGTDIAPVLGEHWTYNLVLGALALRASNVSAGPCAARRREAVHRQHGRHANRHSDGRQIRIGDVRGECRRVDRFAPEAGSRRGGRRCVLTVPRSAGGKLLRGALTVRVEGASVRRAYTFRVLSR